MVPLLAATEIVTGNDEAIAKTPCFENLREHLRMRRGFLCPQVVPPLAAAEIVIAPDEPLLPAGSVSAIVEGMLVVQVRFRLSSPLSCHHNLLLAVGGNGRPALLQLLLLPWRADL